MAWYGDLDFAPHFKTFVQRGAVDVTVTFGTAVPFDGDTDRKSADTIDRSSRCDGSPRRRCAIAQIEIENGGVT